MNEQNAVVKEVRFDGDCYLTPYWDAYRREDGTIRIHTATPYGTTTDTVVDNDDDFYAWRRRHYGYFPQPETNRRSW